MSDLIKTKKEKEAATFESPIYEDWKNQVISELQKGVDLMPAINPFAFVDPSKTEAEPATEPRDMPEATKRKIRHTLDAIDDGHTQRKRLEGQLNRAGRDVERNMGLDRAYQYAILSELEAALGHANGLTTQAVLIQGNTVDLVFPSNDLENPLGRKRLVPGAPVFNRDLLDAQQQVRDFTELIHDTEKNRRALCDRLAQELESHKQTLARLNWLFDNLLRNEVSTGGAVMNVSDLETLQKAMDAEAKINALRDASPEEDKPQAVEPLPPVDDSPEKANP